MARTFIASDPRSGRREVIVEVRPELTGGANAHDLEPFERRLYDRHVHAGLLITPGVAYFVRDTLAELGFSPGSYDVKELPTATLFRMMHRGIVTLGEDLYTQVRSWLRAVAGSWSTSVPDEALPMMLPEMVGGLAEAQLEEWDDVLDAE
jgi:hypothetical protein